MATNQEQASTVGQPIKEPIGTNQPAQNCAGQSTSTEKSASPSGKSVGQKSVIWGANPLGRKQYFSFKNCKTWNQYKQTCATQYIRCDIDPHYSDCAGLNIPDDPHPWNALRTVIDQFYQREKNIAWERFDARKAIEKAAKLEERNKELDNIYWKQDDRIVELKKELNQMQEIADIALERVCELDKINNKYDDSHPLSKLLQQCDAGEWVEAIGGIIDCIIGLSCYEGNTIKASDLYSARRLQEFFMKLDKEG